MSNIRKYAFDTEFAPNGEILRESVGRLSPLEFENANAASYERGKQEAAAHTEHRIATALEAIADAASAVLTRLDAESNAMRMEATHVAMTAARKIAGAALDAYSVERAAEAVEAAMDMLRHQPRLVVKLPPADAEALQPRIAKMCESHAYVGAILVRADATLGVGSVTVDWSDGIITLDPADAQNRLEDAINTALAAPHETPP